MTPTSHPASERGVTRGREGIFRGRKGVTRGREQVTRGREGRRTARRKASDILVAAQKTGY